MFMYIYLWAWEGEEKWVYVEMPCFERLILQVTCFFLSPVTKVFAERFRTMHRQALL